MFFATAKKMPAHLHAFPLRQSVRNIFYKTFIKVLLTQPVIFVCLTHHILSSPLTPGSVGFPVNAEAVIFISAMVLFCWVSQ